MYSSEAEFTKSGTFSINDIPAQWKNRITDVFNVNFMRIILMSSFFFLLFFSFNTTQNFETTVNSTVGFWSLSVLYFFFSFSNFFSSTVVRKLGERISLFVGGVTYTLFIASNLYPAPYIIIPLSALNGIGAAVLWNAQGAYITKYSDADSISFNSGVFFGIFMLNMVFGNLFAAFFLKRFSDDTGTIGIVPSANFYLFLVFSIVALAGTAGFLFLRNPKKVFDKSSSESNVSVLETVQLFKDQTLLLLTPICIYSGLSQSLNFGSFTSLIGNTITIGYVMSVFGLADCLGSIFNGVLSQKFGKRCVIIFSSISALLGFILSTVASQVEHQGSYFVGYYYISALFLGYADSGFNTQIYSMLGSYYPKQSEAAFAAFKLLQAMSTSIAFFYSPYVGYPFLVLICTFFLFLGLILLAVLDRWVNPIDGNMKKRTYMTDSDYAVSDTDMGE